MPNFDTAPRSQLLAKARELADRLANRESIAVERHPDPLDDAWQHATRETAAGELAKNKEMLRAVEDAIERIDAGTYGLCTGCERPISKQRLAYLPWAERCVGCQAKREGKG